MLTNIWLITKTNLEEYYKYFKNFFNNNYDKLIEIIIFYIILSFLYFLVKFLISKIIRFTIKIRIIPKNHDHQHLKERIESLFSVIRSILKIVFVLVLIFFVLKEFEIKIIPLITGAGVLGAALVFSFQGVIQDIIKGWILIFEDQARKGEWVNVNNTFIGKVVEFNLRYLVLMDKERNYVFIPNNQINFITNLSRADKKTFIGIRFNKDINLESEIEEIKKFVENHKSKYRGAYDLKLEEKINITPEYYEIFISFKSKFSLIEYYFTQIKIDLIKQFKDHIREIT
jgi:small-conductance mechanosensitive channel